jgi:hypothetical protein
MITWEERNIQFFRSTVPRYLMQFTYRYIAPASHFTPGIKRAVPFSKRTEQATLSVWTSSRRERIPYLCRKSNQYPLGMPLAVYSLYRLNLLTLKRQNTYIYSRPQVTQTGLGSTSDFTSLIFILLAAWDFLVHTKSSGSFPTGIMVECTGNWDRDITCWLRGRNNSRIEKIENLKICTLHQSLKV